MAALRETGAEALFVRTDVADVAQARACVATTVKAFGRIDSLVNAAGPFAVTAAPVIEAALRAGIPYVDVAAEIEANADTFTHFAARARAAGAVIVPAMAFYGGLGDQLATAAMGDWTAADEAHVAYGLSGWHPTPGTRAAGRHMLAAAHQCSAAELVMRLGRARERAAVGGGGQGGDLGPLALDLVAQRPGGQPAQLLFAQNVNQAKGDIGDAKPGEVKRTG